MSIITDKLTQDELLAMLAEEAAELAQAALKLRRVITGVNPTPTSEEEAVRNLNEEIADVQLCLEQIAARDLDLDAIVEFIAAKRARWIKRLTSQE